MRAKSARLAADRRKAGARPRPGAVQPRSSGPRMKFADRREQILAKAADFFSEYGLTAQTRALADACGVSQRMLYRVFPSKDALLAALYEREIVGPFKAVWFARLADRARPVVERLTAFYEDYFRSVLARRWLRLFLYASLAEADMAPAYIAAIVTRILETIVEEAAAEQDLVLPRERALVHEIGWTLHGAVSHLAIRREVYNNATEVPVDRVIDLHVRAFLAALPALLAPARPAARSARSEKVVS